jgi:hypothetical protein
MVQIHNVGLRIFGENELEEIFEEENATPARKENYPTTPEN